jgi:hypothetical protein
VAVLAHYPNDYTPDLEFAVLVKGNGLVIWVLWLELGFAAQLIEALDGVLIVHYGNHDVFMFWLEGFIDHYLVAITNACAHHGITLNGEHEGGWLVLHEVAV